MTESEIYKGLSVLTKSRDKWEESIPYVSSLLESESVKIQAKALWLLGEMGLAFPHKVGDSLPAIASFLCSREPLLRERALNALGRIGRGCFPLVEPYWAGLFRFAHDGEAKVRLAFIWASENIATHTPDPYGDHMAVFARLLHDSDDGSIAQVVMPVLHGLTSILLSVAGETGRALVDHPGTKARAPAFPPDTLPYSGRNPKNPFPERPYAISRTYN